MSGGPPPLERALAWLASRQHGVVARWQLLDLGFGPDAIQYRLRTGRLHLVHRGIYALSPAPLTTKGHWMGAVLACGPDAVLSHLSGAALWGIAADSSTRTEVTAGRSGRVGPHVVKLHRVRELHPEDRTVRDGIPVTSLARTLLDLAEVLDIRRLGRVIEESERLGLFDLRAVEAVIERSRGRRGRKPLIAALAEHRAAGAPITHSELERLFVAFCREAGLPAPSMNVWIEGYEVDASWPGTNLVVELDGYEYHRSRGAFERDRARDAKLQVAGYRVLRFTYWQLVNDPAAVAATIRSLLGHRAGVRA